MKIERIEKEKLVELAEIETGECFEKNGIVFIITGVSYDNKIECVNLLNGVVIILQVSDFVKPINAKIVIGDDEDE